MKSLIANRRDLEFQLFEALDVEPLVSRPRFSDHSRDPELGLANASAYLEAFGQVVVAWMWLRQGAAALRGLAHAEGTARDFYEGKLAACRWFFGWELPAIEHPLSRLAALDPTCLEVRPRQL
jgi:hypothetical protein